MPVLLPVRACKTGYGLTPQIVSEWVDTWHIDGLLTQKNSPNGCMSTQFRFNRGAQMAHRYPASRHKLPRFAPSRRDIVPQPLARGPLAPQRGHAGTSSLSTAHAGTPRHQDRPSEYTPHVRSYPAHAYPFQDVATALQSAHSGDSRFPGKRPHATGGITRRATRSIGQKVCARVGGGCKATQACCPTREARPRAEQSAQQRRDESFSAWRVYRYTFSDDFHRQID